MQCSNLQECHVAPISCFSRSCFFKSALAFDLYVQLRTLHGYHTTPILCTYCWCRRTFIFVLLLYLHPTWSQTWKRKRFSPFPAHVVLQMGEHAVTTTERSPSSHLFPLFELAALLEETVRAPKRRDLGMLSQVCVALVFNNRLPRLESFAVCNSVEPKVGWETSVGKNCMTSLDRKSQRAKLLIGNLQKLTYAEKAKLPSTYLD